jgi:hypothetical protein
VLADEEGVEAGVAQAPDLARPAQPALRDRDHVVRDVLDEVERGLQVHGQRAEVAVVHPHDGGLQGKGALEIVPVVDLEDRLELRVLHRRVELAQGRVRRGRPR